jgi:hypothetical protein
VRSRISCKVTFTGGTLDSVALNPLWRPILITSISPLVTAVSRVATGNSRLVVIFVSLNSFVTSRVLPRSSAHDFLAPEGRVRPGALIATARPTTALLTEMWQQAETVRRTWLDVGLSIEPADRSTTEEVLAELALAVAAAGRGAPRADPVPPDPAARRPGKSLAKPRAGDLQRPVELRVAPVPGGLDGEVELDRGGGKPAVVYRDGWST